MEITFFLPPGIARWPWAEQLSALEKFWDSEAPRFGEPSAQGWCNSVDGSSAPSAPSQPLPPSLAVDDPFTRWLAAEAVADEAILSARTEDEPRPVADGLTDEDDPYRLVLFPDVQSFVVPLYSDSSRTQLVYALFGFLDLPFVPPEVSTSTPFFSDSFLLNTLAHSPLGRAAFFPDHLRNPGVVPRKLIGDGGMEPKQEGGIPSPYDCPVKASPVTTEALLPASTVGPSLLARHSVDDRLKPVIRSAFPRPSLSRVLALALTCFPPALPPSPATLSSSCASSFRTTCGTPCTRSRSRRRKTARGASASPSTRPASGKADGSSSPSVAPSSAPSPSSPSARTRPCCGTPTPGSSASAASSPTPARST